ncbi:23S rRNA pseudouridine synthase F [Niastella koreensis]|uniref:Pseudouridine synthase n=2 Tax=Niastella koreensis TaxID=354356 RepID=G8TFF6_NIAKG|nr:23S rRNA pseudouridine(2604) synthase RluF [Niastella koreensis]AEV98387.1 pseudouridine synthase Rsu [Niastella koreensis GR20-10]OQP53335.1 23S rRNA pseudouridine synthase F [Niastella koreensis]
MDNSISLNKFISDTGYCSRREADNLITAGRVLLNNRPAQLGNRYKPGDTVEVDGSLITAAKKEKRVYLALNKPAGITTTTELHVKDNIISFIGYPKRIFPIGRLDKDSEGLILLTNDGDIINKILRAENYHEKEYIVRVNKPIDNAFIQQMSQGVPILDTVTLPCKVHSMGRQTFRITLTQGLNRQIRRMCEYLGYAVTGLQRVRIMNIKLDKLALGKWRYLSDAELSILMENISDSSKEKTPNKPATQTATPPKRGFKPKDGRQAGKGKGTKPATREDKPHTGKKPERSWKREGADGKSRQVGTGRQTAESATRQKSPKGQPTRPEKNGGKEKKGPESKKGRRGGAEGSFKNYRNKGRR